MKKTLIAGLILVTVSIGVQASADSINGYQVTLTDSNTAIGKNGLILSKVLKKNMTMNIRKSSRKKKQN